MLVDAAASPGARAVFLARLLLDLGMYDVYTKYTSAPADAAIIAYVVSLLVWGRKLVGVREGNGTGAHL